MYSCVSLPGGKSAGTARAAAHAGCAALPSAFRPQADCWRCLGSLKERLPAGFLTSRCSASAPAARAPGWGGGLRCHKGKKPDLEDLTDCYVVEEMEGQAPGTPAPMSIPPGQMILREGVCQGGRTSPHCLRCGGCCVCGDPSPSSATDQRSRRAAVLPQPSPTHSSLCARQQWWVSCS